MTVALLKSMLYFYQSYHAAVPGSRKLQQFHLFKCKCFHPLTDFAAWLSFKYKSHLLNKTKIDSLKSEYLIFGPYFGLVAP